MAELGIDLMITKEPTGVKTDGCGVAKVTTWPGVGARTGSGAGRLACDATAAGSGVGPATTWIGVGAVSTSTWSAISRWMLIWLALNAASNKKRLMMTAKSNKAVTYILLRFKVFIVNLQGL
jgi:hypothetical protein